MSESKLSSFHPDSGFLINGFQIPFRRDCQENAGGGVLVYVKDGVCCKRRADLEQANLECIWLEIRPSKSKPFLIANIIDHQIQPFSGMKSLKKILKMC